MNKIKLKGQLKTYMRWPIYLTLLLIAMNIWIYVLDQKAGFLMSIFIVIYALIASLLYFYNKPVIFNELVAFATHYGQVQKTLLKEMTIAYGILDMDGKIIWMNKAFSEAVGPDVKTGKSIMAVFGEISKEMVVDGEELQNIPVVRGESHYNVELQKVRIDSLVAKSDLVELPEQEEYLIAAYLFDETEVHKYKTEYEEQRMVAGLIYIDNYEEALESVEEVRRSLLTALIERKINKYISGIDGIVKRMEKDKYFIAIKQKYVAKLKQEKFDLLDEVKNVNIGNEMAVTLSIGLGVGGSTYGQNYEYARIAIDLALGRGGDQAVVKEGDQIYYYGGKSKQVEKNTRVKARVKAHALREFMSSTERVVVMGHKIGDVDSFGAAIGIYRAAKVLDKKAYIVINDITVSVRPLMEMFLNSDDYEDDMFINGDEAIDLVDNNTTLVVVDVNKPSYTECEALLNLTKTIVVLDHHRQSSEVIEGAVLSYIEPYASSTCEMVAEVLQYFDDVVKIGHMEADCMYSGMMIDTNNFMTKTGVRTFEAAAFLRRCGADITRVRKMFRDDMESYRTKAEAVRQAEVYRDYFAISVCPSDIVDSPTIVGAQAANELLNISGIKASFVLTEYNGKIYVSARSIDEVNVQIIMERLGGGGHMSTAGTQMTCEMPDAIKKLKDTLDEMLEGGDI